MSAKILTAKHAGKTYEKLVYDDYMFVKYKPLNDGQQWRCDNWPKKKGGCTAKVWTKTNSENRIIITNATQHNEHPKASLDNFGQSKDAIIEKLQKEVEAHKKEAETSKKEAETSKKDVEAYKKEAETLKNFILSKGWQIPPGLLSSNDGIEAQSQFAQMPPATSSAQKADNFDYIGSCSPICDISLIELDPDFQPLHRPELLKRKISRLNKTPKMMTGLTKNTGTMYTSRP